MTPDESARLADIADAERCLTTGTPVAPMTVRGLLAALRDVAAKVQRVEALAKVWEQYDDSASIPLRHALGGTQ